MTFDTTMVVLVLAVVGFGGVVKGLVGFGYAIASTAVLATLLDPAAAVVVMILPMLVANLSVARTLSAAGLRSCVRRFWPYVAAAAVGTVLGMLVLEDVPGRVLATGLGLFTVGYVVLKQPYATVPGIARLRAVCFTPGLPAKVGVGLASGFVFGASNAAVQVVAYLDSLDLDRETFAGVLAMILIGVSLVRVGLAWGLGLFGGGDALLLSVAAAVPGVVGVALGQRGRRYFSERAVTAGTFLLLAVIAVRLLARGLFGV
ncbi:sulfite exporter TauE/SafE family protein [Haloarchaeobius iranensis]|uniref:Probable membrane transporter protein n=1 Tax=Haloarchaeobius iranensis TaxID=996166 RepID=A0A1G9TLK9_9EURY|nr:sulfite exporter TauE/SafE family protein [Haloarchaeobius iranensis]SDM48542.1 hypothetical protein SAMN05192554_1036 [Haloarchaeobius iranensis]